MNDPYGRTEPRNVQAVFRFSGGPGRGEEAARAWAFELTYYFCRGVGEQPSVIYEDGVYSVTGLMTTTHPGDKTVTMFNNGESADLDFVLNEGRVQRLKELYPKRPCWFDGRDHIPAPAAEDPEYSHLDTMPCVREAVNR